MEMISDCGDFLQQRLVDEYNRLLHSGFAETGWHDTFFKLLPKTCNLKEPANWRPIAILNVSYKLMARMVYNRLHMTLEKHQPDEQFGFRPKRSTTDALLILEHVVGTSVKCNADLWFASLDLRKAFDRILWPHLFEKRLMNKRCLGLTNPC